MLVVLVFIVWTTMAHISVRMAQQKNRSPIAWLALVFCVGLLAIIILYFLPLKKEEKQVPIQQNPPPTFQKFWYYLDKENKQYGPISLENLKEAWHLKKVLPSTFLWNHEMENWKPLNTLPDIFHFIQK